MKRKLMAMTLALMLMLTLAITVSAASVSGGGTYEGYGYETYDTCQVHSFSSMTIYDSTQYYVYSNVTMNWTGYNTSTGTTVTLSHTFPGSPAYTMSTNTKSVGNTISSIYCVHYIGDDVVHTAKVYPD